MSGTPEKVFVIELKATTDFRFRQSATWMLGNNSEAVIQFLRSCRTKSVNLIQQPKHPMTFNRLFDRKSAKRAVGGEKYPFMRFSKGKGKTAWQRQGRNPVPVGESTNYVITIQPLNDKAKTYQLITSMIL